MVEICDALVAIPAMLGIKLHACSAVTTIQHIFVYLVITLFGLHHQGVHRVNGHGANAAEHCHHKRCHKQNAEEIELFQAAAASAIGHSNSFKCMDLTHLAHGRSFYCSCARVARCARCARCARGVLQGTGPAGPAGQRICAGSADGARGERGQQGMQKEDIRHGVAEADGDGDHLPEGERT